MSDTIQIQLIGDKTLARALLALPERVQRKVVRQAITAGGRKISKAAKSKAPKETGLLKKSIGIRVWTSKDKQAVGVTIGPRRGFRLVKDGKPRDPVKYSHLVEFGTSHSPAKPFLRPAFDSSGPPVQLAAMKKIATGVEREAKKLAAKGK